jgi:predicted homoserine dehydrogenase-like protein
MSVGNTFTGSVLRGLEERASAGREIRVALIGAGRFGTTVAAQVGQMRGMTLSVVCDLNPVSGMMAAEAAMQGNVDRIRRTDDPGQVALAIAGHQCALMTDLERAVDSPVDVVVEATGRCDVAARVAARAIDQGKHVVMVTVEADVLCGAALAARARPGGVVYTLADGDQPAVTRRMVDWARAAGYTVVAAGRGTRMYPDDPTGRPEDAFARYGFDPEIVDRRRFNPRMYNSFRDGSKAQIEMCALANCTGLSPDRRGMHEPSAGISDLPKLFRPKHEGGLLSRVGVVDLANAVSADGRSLVPEHIANGVWVVVSTDQPLLREDLPFYGIPASDDHRYAAFWRAYHLCGIETPMSIADAALFGIPTAAVTGAPVADVLTVAKRDISPGEQLDGSGGALVRGQIERIETALEIGALPLGLADAVAVRRGIRRGEVIGRNDVDLPRTDLLAILRAEHEALARQSSGL